MASITDKLLLLAQTKSDIKDAIIEQGQELTDEPFSAYAEKILAIESGGGGGGPEYEFEPLIDVPGGIPIVKTQTVTIEEDCFMMAALNNWQSQGNPALNITFYVNGVASASLAENTRQTWEFLSAGDELYVQVRLMIPPGTTYSAEGEIYIAFVPSPSFTFEQGSS